MECNRYFTIFMFLLLYSAGNMLFWVATHNLDNLHNFGLWYNDQNVVKYGDSVYNVRDIHDCPVVGGCPDYKKNYNMGLIMHFVSYTFFNMIIVGVILEKWHKKEQASQ